MKSRNFDIFCFRNEDNIAPTAADAAIEVFRTKGFFHTRRLEVQFQHRRPDLDLLRLIFFLMVFVAHTPRFPHLGWIMNAGGNGVCFFFLLSAFLITDLLMQEKARTRLVHVGSFLLRRSLRIFPLYFFAVVVGTALGLLIPSIHVLPQSLPWLLSLTYNFYIARHGWGLNALGPLWSLSVEVQFYLAIPWIVKFGGRRVLGMLAVACFPASYGTLLSLGRAHAVPGSQVWVNSMVQFQFFAAGILLALYFHAQPWNISILRRGSLLTAGGALLMAGQRAVHLHGVMPLTASRLCCGYLLILLSGIMLFLSLFNWPLPIHRSLLYLGKISYGLYVYHTFFLLVLVYRVEGRSPWQLLLFDVISLGLTILTAIASYEYFERPFLRLKQRTAVHGNIIG
jgi:peptidoglycan/LPS O-acetylase OafA/YrhL